MNTHGFIEKQSDITIKYHVPSLPTRRYQGTHGSLPQSRVHFPSVAVQVVPEPILLNPPAACSAQLANYLEALRPAVKRLAYGTSAVANGSAAA